MVPEIVGYYEEGKIRVYVDEFVQYLINSLYNSYLFLNLPFLLVADIAQSILWLAWQLDGVEIVVRFMWDARHSYFLQIVQIGDVFSWEGEGLVVVEWSGWNV